MLDQGRVDLRLVPRGWKLRPREQGGSPVFLQGFLDRVFDRKCAVLLDEPDIDAILAIRQLTLMFAKIRLPASDSRRAKAMSDFVECEQDVRVADSQRSPIDLERFQRVSALLFRDVFTRVDREIYNGKAVPRHGPGATADRLVGNQKYLQSEWTARLEEVFPAGEFLLPNWRYYDQLERVDILEPGAERPVRVISVPKTLKTPRIIAIEPTAMQYAQQAVLPLLLDAIHGDFLLGDMLGFLDQKPNQHLAEIGSLTKRLATLDLSEASDRVSNQLVSAMLQPWPYLHGAVDACRSRNADVDGHGVIPLAKFASMGSALTFPMEAMVFLTMIFLGIEQELNTTLSRRDVVRVSREVRVYGDDIIVPTDYVQSVVSSLEHFGAKVNTGKSFWTGRFRESCGKEYYHGSDVSIVRVRDIFPSRRQDATRVISLVSLRNQLYRAGYWETVKWLDNKILKLLKWFPVVSESSRVLGRHSFLGYQAERVGRDYHDPQVRGWVVDAQLPVNSIDGYAALLKCLLKLGVENDEGYHLADDLRKKIERDQLDGLSSLSLRNAEGTHLERSGRPSVVNLKLRWAPAW